MTLGVTPLITALQYEQREIAMVLLDGRSDAQLDVRSPQDGRLETKELSKSS